MIGLKEDEIRTEIDSGAFGIMFMNIKGKELRKLAEGVVRVIAMNNAAIEQDLKKKGVL
ncbi:MAG TPA: hypothetical protein G4O10_08210 [Dehalococcoidia bacterium]|nr:hypothetical protein [Dehalococcoidia bacterium]